jgi:type III restriction enzyme
VKTGDVTQQTRDLLEDMRIPCGRYLQEQIRIMSKNCLNALNPALFSNAKLDKTACFRSKALEHYRELAIEIVAEYENHVHLGVLVDPHDRDYAVGPYQPSGAILKTFSHAAHPHYDAKSFNPDELEMAKALDKFDYVWARNRDRLDYGIPLPLKSATSSTFYPDFLWWVNGTIWAIDPTGKHILNEKIRAKLFSVPDPMKIALVTRGRLDVNFKKLGEDGWTLVRIRMGNAAPENFESLSDMLSTLIAETGDAAATV